jgi:hypothetical protein
MDFDTTKGSEVHQCVRCGKALPPASKMSRLAVTSAEATTNQWLGEENVDGTVSVEMCLQCQILRSARSERLS